MLNHAQIADLYNVYGDLIREVAQQQAKRSKGIHRFAVLEADDIEQDLYTRLIESGTGVGELQALTGPGNPVEAWLRSTSRLYAVLPRIRQRIGTEERRLHLADFEGSDPSGKARGHESDAEPTWRWVTEDPAYADESAEDVVLSKEAEREAKEEAADVRERTRRVVLGILARVPSDADMRAMEGFYLQGLDTERIAELRGGNATSVRKALHRGRKAIGPEDSKVLEVYRAAYFPEARMPNSRNASEPRALLEALG